MAEALHHDEHHPMETPRGRIADVAEVASLFLLAAFLGFSAWTGRVRFFLAPIYVWLPAFAAVALLAMAAGRLWVLMRERTTCCCEAVASPTARAIYAIVLLVPVVMALTVDPRQFSADGMRKRRASFAARDPALDRAMNWVLGVKGAPAGGGTASPGFLREPTVLDLLNAVDSGQAAALEGRFVHVIGQCAPRDDPRAGRFDLYRLVITCCVADATAVSIEVVGLPAVNVEPGQWLRIGGMVRFEKMGSTSQPVLHSATLSKTPMPSDPYL
jgi:uncharacterized repeat protein (TIGR03943 family)